MFMSRDERERKIYIKAVLAFTVLPWNIIAPLSLERVGVCKLS